MSYFVVYSPENEKFLHLNIESENVEWSVNRYSSYKLAAINFIECLYLGKVSRNLHITQEWWSPSEYNSMSNVMNAASASGWCLYVMPMRRFTIAYDLMERLVE